MRDVVIASFNEEDQREIGTCFYCLLRFYTTRNEKGMIIRSRVVYVYTYVLVVYIILE